MWRILLITLIIFFLAACTKHQLDENVSQPTISIELVKAYYYERTGQRSLADKIYQAALRQAPHSGAIHNNYGAFLCRGGEYRRGIQQFLIAATDHSYPKRRIAYHNAKLCQTLIR